MEALSQIHGPMASEIIRKLTEALPTATISLVNDSHRHGNGGAESHFSVRVVSERFAGLGSVARHRLVYQVLAKELAAGVHALAITALTPDEAGNSSTMQDRPPCAGSQGGVETIPNKKIGET